MPWLLARRCEVMMANRKQGGASPRLGLSLASHFTLWPIYLFNHTETLITAFIATLWCFVLFCHRKCLLHPKHHPLGPAMAHRPSDFIWQVPAVRGQSHGWRPQVKSLRLGHSELFRGHNWCLRTRQNSCGSQRWILSGTEQPVHTWIIKTLFWDQGFICSKPCLGRILYRGHEADGDRL